MSKKYVVIKTSGGIITDVWINISDATNCENGLFVFNQIDCPQIRAAGEITILPFNTDSSSEESEYRKYHEYHLVTNLISYDIFARTLLSNQL